MKNENNLVQDFKTLNNLPKNWEVIDFDKGIIDVSGGNKKIKNSDLLNEGSVKVVDQGKELIAGFTNDKEAVVKTEIPHIVFGDHTRVIKYIEFPFAMGADGTKVLKVRKETKSFEKYIYYFFQTLNIPETGYNRHFKYLKECKIPLPNLETQKRLAAILDEADTLRQLNKQLIAKYDALTQSLFLDMFGDPVTNPMGWEKIILKKFGKIVTGNTPSRKNKNNYSSNFIEWIKTDNISSSNIYVTKSKEYLSEEGFKNARFVEKDSLLVACIAGSIKSIGRVALTDRRVSFNQQINAIQPNDDISSRFLYYLIQNSSEYIQEHASNGMKRMLSKGVFEKIEMIKPPIHLQNQFAERVQLIEQQKQQAQDALQKSEALFNSLLQKAFKGAL